MVYFRENINKHRKDDPHISDLTFQHHFRSRRPAGRRASTDEWSTAPRN